jgi:hypothetical protein
MARLRRARGARDHTLLKFGLVFAAGIACAALLFKSPGDPRAGRETSSASLVKSDPVATGSVKPAPTPAKAEDLNCAKQVWPYIDERCRSLAEGRWAPNRPAAPPATEGSSATNAGHAATQPPTIPLPLVRPDSAPKSEEFASADPRSVKSATTDAASGTVDGARSADTTEAKPATQPRKTKRARAHRERDDQILHSYVLPDGRRVEIYRDSDTSSRLGYADDRYPRRRSFFPSIFGNPYQ